MIIAAHAVTTGDEVLALLAVVALAVAVTGGVAGWLMHIRRDTRRYLVRVITQLAVFIGWITLNTVGDGVHGWWRWIALIAGSIWVLDCLSANYRRLERARLNDRAIERMTHRSRS